MGIITIEKLVPGGSGFGHLDDGSPVLVDGGLPGERLLVVETRRQRGMLRATRYRILSPSTQRVEPVCGEAARCGGCDWMHLDSKSQRHFKLGMLDEALRRIGKFYEPLPAIDFVASPDQLHYRHRIRLQVSGAGSIGFFSRGSHDLVQVKECFACRRELWQVLLELRDYAQAFPSGWSSVKHVEVRYSPLAPHFAVCLTPKDPGQLDMSLLESLAGHHSEWLCADQSQTDVGRRSWQKYPLVDGRWMYAPPGAFVQVNWPVNQLLITSLRAGARRRNIASFADLYAGAGNLSLPLLGENCEGYAFETNRSAMAAARVAASEQRLMGRFETADVQRALSWLCREPSRLDLVIVDPPRAGVAAGIDALARLSPRYIAMCSCNPATLARDLRLLVDRGYTLESITAFDMFPQTHHLETLVWLRRM